MSLTSPSAALLPNLTEELAERGAPTAAETKCYFEPRSDGFVATVEPVEGLHLSRCVQRNVFQLTSVMPMSTVVEVFRRMGIRQALVTLDGRLTGVITKKDVIRHIDTMEDRHTPSVPRWMGIR